MSRSCSPPSPPPRWLRRMMIFGSMNGLSLVTVRVCVPRPTLFDAVTVPLCVLALILLAHWELRAERHATPAMEARYLTLSRLLDGSGAGNILVDAEKGVAIMFVSSRGAD